MSDHPVDDALRAIAETTRATVVQKAAKGEDMGTIYHDSGLSRRQFIETAGLATALVTLGAPLASAATAGPAEARRYASRGPDRGRRSGHARSERLDQPGR